MKYFNLKSYHVMITDEAEAKMNAYIDLAKEEISGLGTVREEDGLYIIDDVFIFNQTCSPTTTVLDQDKIMEFITDLINDGKDEIVNRLRLWWHSHADFGVFWSGTDRNTINSMNADPVWISIVGNKRGNKLVSVDYYNPRISIDDVNLGVIKTEKNLDNIYENCKKEIEEKVNESPFGFYKNIKREKELDEMNKILEEIMEIESE